VDPGEPPRSAQCQVMPGYSGILHHSVLVADSARAVAFYHGVLGMPLLARPGIGFPGAWLAVGGQQIHLLELPNPDPVDGRPAHGGRDRHVAIGVDDLNAVRRRLDEAGLPYTLSRSGRRALFCRDPDGNGLEFIQTP
jgi:glyoxylase I family protein